jgi:hypothetical protein
MLKHEAFCMTELANNEPLKIRLTATPPYWATENIAVLRQQPCLEIFEADSPVDDSLIDIVLHFGHYDKRICEQYGRGRLGFWFFRFGGQDLDVTTAARRAATVSVAFESSLWAKLPDDNCVCLYQSFGQLDHFAIWRSVDRTLAKAAYYPERVLSRYRRKGELVINTPEPIAISTAAITSRVAEVCAVLRKICHKLFYHEQWFIVVGKGQDLVPDPSKHQWLLNPPADCFWADPFPVEKEGRLWVLLEVLPFSTSCGYLAAVELFADGCYSAVQPIMNTGSHLSYPFLFNWQGELYMLPEAGATREVTLWQCKNFPDAWTKAATLLTDVFYTDATLIEHDGLWWLFLTIGEEDGICTQDELHLYYADSPLGPWTCHSENPVKSDARNARPAGNLFYRDGVLYRPAQDCATDYGKATVLNRIDRLNKQEFTETPVARIDSGWQVGCRCTHTLSRSEHYWAVDGLHLIPRWAALFKWIKH